MAMRVTGSRPLRLARHAILFTALFMVGCQAGTLGGLGQSADTSDMTQPDGKQQKKPDGPYFAEFRDIPIPINAKIDFDDLLVLGGGEGWIGRLVLNVGYSMTDMYAFYEREMPRFGWTRITSVRAAISTMTYQRGERIASVTLQGRMTGGATIYFTVAPASGGANTGQPAAPGRS